MTFTLPYPLISRYSKLFATMNLMSFHISYVSLHKIGGISAIKTSKLALYCTRFALSFGASNTLFFSHNVTLLLQNSASSASKIIRRKYKNNFEHLLNEAAVSLISSGRMSSWGVCSTVIY